MQCQVPEVTLLIERKEIQRFSRMVAVGSAMSPPDASLGAPLLAADLLEKLATPASKTLSIADTAPSTPQLVAGG